MYEQSPQQLAAARSTVFTDTAVDIWTAARTDDLAMQAIALMDWAGVPLPPGTIDDLVSIRIPAAHPAGVDTEFHPLGNQEVQATLARGGRRNLGELRLGDNVQVARVRQAYSGLTENQVRVFQLRGLIHELLHALDFGDVVQLTAGDHDAAIVLQAQYLGFARNRPGYARNEIDTDQRAGTVLERNGLLFAELRQSLDDYRVFWKGQGPLSEAAFAAALAALNRTRYP
jgi:hypothetical protein